MRSPLWTCAELLSACNGVMYNPNHSNNHVSGIEIDSRKCRSGDLFIALTHGQQDGHKFLKKAVDAGAVGCLVSHPQDNLDIMQIVVDNTLTGLTHLGIAGRKRFSGKMIGITGSVGKTGSKDMLAHILTNFSQTHASQSSFNNYLGVPITLSTLPADYKFGIQEMGMNASGEIATLTALARPDVAMITRVTSAHSGFFHSLDDIAMAKAEIFCGLSDGGVAVLNLDDTYFPMLALSAKKAGASRIITFGKNKRAEFCLIDACQNPNGMNVQAKVLGEELNFDMEMHGTHWAENALGVLACVEALGLCTKKASSLLASCPTPKGRGTRLKGHYKGHPITLIDDSYNASPESMTAAFASMLGTPPNIMILSEMRELGNTTAIEHKALIKHINAMSPRFVIALGPALHETIGELNNNINAVAAEDAVDAYEALKTIIKDDDVVFIKGSLSSGASKVRDAIVTELRLNSSTDLTSYNGGDTHAT